MLGSQCLSELRDKFHCIADHMLDGPNHKSGFVFLEDVFYNDMRDPANVDYSV